MSTFGELGTFGDGDSVASYGDLTYGGGVGLGTIPRGPTDTSQSSVILSLDGDEIALDRWQEGWAVTKVDVGTPTHRDVTDNRPGGDGSYDYTVWSGPRNIVIQLVIAGDDRQRAMDALARYLGPDQRPTLKLRTELLDAHRHLTVRHTGDLTEAWERPGVLKLAVGFRSVGSPWFVSATDKQETAWPLDDKPGTTFPISFDVSFPSTEGIGPAQLTNNGSRPAEWVARIFGPITAPRLILAATGHEVTFKDTLTVAAGDYLTVDSTARTALYNGESGASRYEHLDFAATTWFRLPPGQNVVRLSGDDYLSPAQAEITFRDTYL